VKLPGHLRPASFLDFRTSVILSILRSAVLAFCVLGRTSTQRQSERVRCRVNLACSCCVQGRVESPAVSSAMWSVAVVAAFAHSVTGAPLPSTTPAGTVVNLRIPAAQLAAVEAISHGPGPLGAVNRPYRFP
jgi:hypothetical protein